ncbi:glycosyltransferase family 2 protein [Nitrosopumilus piranensis]|uniref:Putative Glycosyl transferase family 2 n=1 Tax=Nitrosopumilus piranensis TaxID=1582439 RepID=A0A0C5BT08_9ARCH|nr:glycosyltransferase family 2 protein [Nitrosopumilus piranensis]AJM91274.1 putative Glycosyl transferase family 2 [Nitrosopumilus piranensis]
MLSIGLPVYNGEKSIEKSINSLLNQTFTDFELIISDNASNDNTEKICREYAKKDSRIKYYRQDKNIGFIKNYEYVLKQSEKKYFMFTSDHDIKEKTFIEKNIQVLESDPNTVGSISEIDFYGNEKELKIRYRGKGNYKIKEKYRFVHPAKGSFQDKFVFYLNFMESSMLYGIFRRKELQNCIGFHHQPWDLMVILRILEYGDLHVIDEILLHRFVGGLSSKDIYKNLRGEKFSRIELLFMFAPFFRYVINQFGFGFFIKNFKIMIKLCIRGHGRIILDNFRKMRDLF